jgi:hypothetical protein
MRSRHMTDGSGDRPDEGIELFADALVMINHPRRDGIEARQMTDKPTDRTTTTMGTKLTVFHSGRAFGCTGEMPREPRLVLVKDPQT